MFNSALEWSVPLRVIGVNLSVIS